jgi:hypothetical protein
MKKYRIFVPVGATAILEVEANSEAEALEQMCSPSVCHQCCHDVELGELYDEEAAEIFEIEE